MNLNFCCIFLFPFNSLIPSQGLIWKCDWTLAERLCQGSKGCKGRSITQIFFHWITLKKKLTRNCAQIIFTVKVVLVGLKQDLVEDANEVKLRNIWSKAEYIWSKAEKIWPKVKCIWQKGFVMLGSVPIHFSVLSWKSWRKRTRSQWVRRRWLLWPER